MADRPTGPVKPPVIDLTARAGSPRPEQDRPAADEPRRRAFDGTALLARYWPALTVLVGIIVAALLAYLISTANRAAPPPDLTPQLVAQSERIDALETELGALRTELGGAEADLATVRKTGTNTQVSLDATIVTLDTGLTEVKQSIAQLQAAIPAVQAPVDLAPLEAQIRTLKAQVDAIAAGASGADAGVIAQSLSDLETSVASLSTRLNGVDSTVTALRTDLDAARKTLTDHINAALPSEVGPAMKLPLILSGLESAFATGRPFQAELASLKSVLPDFPVPTTLDTAAPLGLSRPDELMRRFETALPDILAARGPGSGDWVQNGVDWAKSLLALRPAEEIEGDSPEAIVSRLEAAMTRRDYAAATGLVASLPAPMQAAAAPVATDIIAHADADKLVSDLRARALAPVETAQ